MKPIEFIQMLDYEGLENMHMSLIEKGECCGFYTFIKEDLKLNINRIQITVAEGYDPDYGGIGQHYIAAIYEDDAADFMGARICDKHPADVVIMDGKKGIYLYDLGEIEYLFDK